MIQCLNRLNEIENGTLFVEGDGITLVGRCTVLHSRNLCTQQMDDIWEFMGDENQRVQKLTEDGKNWTYLSEHELSSLIDLYEEVLNRNVKNNNNNGRGNTNNNI